MRSAFVFLALLLGGCAATNPQKEALSSTKQLDDPSALLERGIAYEELGDYTRAEQYLSGALSKGADPHKALPPLLRACVKAGHLRLAAEYAESALARRPSDAHLRFLTGALEATVGNPVDGRKLLEKAASELPDDAHVQFHVAAFFRDDLHDQPGADPYFRNYLRLQPQGEHAEEARASIMERVQ